MTLDIQVSLITSLYNLLIADATLQSAMGGSVAFYPIWAPPDSELPYLVHRTDFTVPENDFFPVRRGTLIIDAWSYSPSTSEVLSIRKRVIELLDELDFDTTEIDHCRVRLQTDGFVPETEQDMWHYTMQFGLRFYRKSETGVIIAR